LARKRLPAQERRKQILKNAIHVFAQRSYHGATTKMISAEAEVAEALIFRYFGSKRNLFCEAVAQSGKRMVDGLERILEENEDNPGGALEGLLIYYIQLLRRHADLAKMIFLVSAELDAPEVREAYLPHQDRALLLLTRAVASWQRSGRVRGDISPRAAAWLIFGCFQVLALMKHSGKLDEVDVAVAISFVKPYVEGIGVVEPAERG